jgi:hypothetical protein
MSKKKWCKDCLKRVSTNPNGTCKQGHQLVVANAVYTL